MTLKSNNNPSELIKPTISQKESLRKDLIEELSEHHENVIVQKKLTITQTNEVLVNFSKIKSISRGTTVRALGSLFRKRASNAKAKDTISVDINWPNN